LEKEQAAPTWKKTFGLFHPMTAWADHGAGGNGEPLAIVLLGLVIALMLVALYLPIFNLGHAMQSGMLRP